MSIRVHVCMCVPALRLLIMSGVIWIHMIGKNKLYSCCMATVVDIVDGHGLGIDTFCVS